MSHRTEHGITVAAPARVVYDLIADVGQWPRIFPPTVHVDHVQRDGPEERIRIWATANGAPKAWTSRRHLDPTGLQVTFRQEISQAPVAAMGGAWILDPVSATRTEVRLLHDFDAVGDDPESVSLILRAIDHNSGAELAALRSAAEQREGDQDLLLTFDDSVIVDGAAKDVYEFLYAAQQWPSRLPHVAKVSLQEDTPNLQVLDMDTRNPQGQVHTTSSVRVCFPADRIVYKQLRMPPLLTVHTGRWTIRDDGGRTVVTSTHTVVIEPEAIAAVLGGSATVTQARTAIRQALGGNSLATLRHAKAYAEGH
ncbi:aromatase/cyclase [Micromonospora sp. LOL_024]|uniref:aromatase/cyclase n=1 Tax=Micromonospora sp. LOL_024 TaxID=3345412 RepID=UPI003A88DBFD